MLYPTGIPVRGFAYIATATAPSLDSFWGPALPPLAPPQLSEIVPSHDKLQRVAGDGHWVLFSVTGASMVQFTVPSK